METELRLILDYLGLSGRVRIARFKCKGPNNDVILSFLTKNRPLSKFQKLTYVLFQVQTAPAGLKNPAVLYAPGRL